MMDDQILNQIPDSPTFQFNQDLDLSQFDFTQLNELENNPNLLNLLENPICFQDETTAALLSSPYLISDENVELLLPTSDQSTPDMSPLNEFSLHTTMNDLQQEESENSKSFSTKCKKSKPNDAETKGKKTRNRKRQRKDDANESKDISAVQLSRDQLLHFSSADLDVFARNIASSRSLTIAEEKEIKRQKRLIKNRESAQASRERKKFYIDELEAQINELRAENSKLMEQMGYLKDENNGLKEEIYHLHSLYKKQQPNETDSKISFGDFLTIKRPSSEGTQTPVSKKIQTAGVTLLIILFSFGLFFNNLSENRSFPSLPSSFPKFVREEIPQVVPPHSSILNAMASFQRRPLEQQSAPTYKAKSDPIQNVQTFSRNTKEIASSSASASVPTSEQNFEKTSQVMQELYSTKRSDSTPIIGSDQTDGNSEFTYRKVGTEHLYKKKFSAFKVNENENESSLGSIFMSEFANESTPTNSTSKLAPDSALIRWFNDHIDPQPNTAYLACSEAQQIIPPNSSPFDPKSPLFVSFLIPSQQMGENNESNVTLMMEITCQVTDISISRAYASVQTTLDNPSIRIPVA